MLSGAGAHDWSAVELALDRIWFFTTLVEPVGKASEGHHKVFRTPLLAKAQQVVGLAVFRGGVESELADIDLGSPGHLNGSTHWKMDPVSSLWKAKEPPAANQKVWIFETVAGSYVQTDVKKGSNELCNSRLIWRSAV